jgi:MarR family transcriptional regulator, organic hydroperoxide resistance regulator
MVIGDTSPRTTPGTRELTERFFAVMRRLRQHGRSRAAELGLSIVQARVLGALREPMSMRALADHIGLEPANMTGVVDRLESAGFVTREPQPGDRRVKLLVLTDAGRATRDDIVERVFTESPLLDALSDDERRRLSDLLGKVLTRAESGAP